ncbi:MAG: hypothetical protein WC197_00350 [Candidatus Gastranaerophilaceae bacterium]|jgi:hypothetical protein
MKKSLLLLAILAFGAMNQPANAACTINGYAAPFLIYHDSSPTCSAAAPCCPAAPVIIQNATSSIEKVPICKKHWWNLKRDGYRAVCPGLNCGAAAPIDTCGNPVQTCEPVFIPKKHFWESDQTKMMPFCPSSCCPAAPCQSNNCGCGCGNDCGCGCK